MLCPKCGEEYEGNACPRCEGPEIIVNNDEYLRRRKAYEEKQAGKESASSDIEQSEQFSTAYKAYMAYTADIFDKDNTTETPDADETVEAKAAKAVLEEMRKAGVKARTVVASNPGRIKKIAAAIGIALALLIVIISAIAVSISFVNANKGTVYYTKGGKLYQVEASDAKQAAEVENIVFCQDYRHFFETDIPAEVSGKSVSHIMASDKGKYFAATAYDEDRLLYCLYVWNNKECILAAEGTGQITIINVANVGKIIYKVTEIINEEGGTGNTALCVYDMENGSFTEVEENAKRIYVYSEHSTIIYLNGDNVLYIYNYTKAGKPEIVAESADSIYIADDSTEGFYTYKVSAVNSASWVKGFIYSSGGECYYHKIDGSAEDIYLGQASGAGVEFIYKENKFVYRVSSSVLSFASMKNGVVGEYKKIAELGAKSNVIYISAAETLFAIDNSSALLRVKSGSTRTVDERVDDGSLARVINSNKAFTYTKDEARYYVGGIQKKAVQLTDAGVKESLQEVIFCKNKIYYSNTSEELVRCDSGGKNAENLGNVERFWLVR